VHAAAEYAAAEYGLLTGHERQCNVFL